MQSTSTITIIFPEQLFEELSFSKHHPIYLLEDSLVYGDHQYPLNLHFSKRVFHRATMKAYAEHLTSQGYDVTYVEWHAGLAFTDLLPVENLTEITCYDFSDFIREKRLHTFCQENNITLNKITTPYFLNASDENATIINDKKPRMQSFYIHQRKKFDILVDEDDVPTGGKWSFDEENRKKIPLEEITNIP